MRCPPNRVNSSALETGRLSEARRREALSSSIPETWGYDNSPVVIFQARMMERRGQVEDALEYLATTAERVKDRFPFAWFKLLRLEAEMAYRAGLSAPIERLQEAARVAEALRLSYWLAQFRELEAHVQGNR